MHADDELEKWQRQWRAQPEVPVDLRQLVERDIRNRRLMLLASIAVTAIMGGGTALWAMRSADPDVFVLALIVWVFLFITWRVTMQLERERGPRPLTDTTAAFLDYAIRSRQVRRKAMIFSAEAYIGFALFILVWRYRAAIGDPMPDAWTYMTSPRVLTFLAVSAGLAVRAAFEWRRLDRELKNLLSMRDAAERSESVP
jgi:hypothetical protein